MRKKRIVSKERKKKKTRMKILKNLVHVNVTDRLELF